MVDQAAKLREMTEKLNGKEGATYSNAQFSNIIAISSGKGGVGKTNIVTNLSYALTKLGKKVVIFDADFGLANIDILLGISPKYTLKDVLSGEKEISDILVKMPNGVTIIPGSQGAEEIANLDVTDRKRSLKQCLKLRESADYLLIDTSAGIHRSVIDMVMAAGRLVVVTTPEPTSITDAYSLIKIVVKNQPKKDIALLVNNVRSSQEAKDIYENMNKILIKFLGRSIDYFGFMLYDNIVTNAVRKQKPFFDTAPNSHAAKCIETIARKLIGDTPEKVPGSSTMYGFFKRLLGVR